MLDADKTKALIERLLSAQRIGCKAVKVGRSGSLLLTFYSVGAARDAAAAMSQFITDAKIGEGYDESPAGLNGRRTASRVWRLAAMMEA